MFIVVGMYTCMKLRSLNCSYSEPILRTKYFWRILVPIFINPCLGFWPFGEDHKYDGDMISVVKGA